LDFEQRQSALGYEKEYNTSFHKLLRMFTISILISFIGTMAGMAVPPALFLPLVIVEFIMLISAFFIRRRKSAIGYGFVYTFCFLSGITLYPTVAYYAHTSGFTVVNTAFLVTAAMFAGLTFYAYFSKRDFSFLAGFLFMGLITLVGFGLISLFTGGFNGPLGLGIAIGGTIIFSGYILFDISRYKQGLTEENIPLAVLNLYLDFINLFLYVLRILGYSRD
jgi:modulator of FtsH protease